MSLGCLIVEASRQSGSLITARLALEQSRDVYAIPGSIHSPQSKGCQALLKQGAKLVEDAQDILEEVAVFMQNTFTLAHSEKAIDVSQNGLLELIGHDPVGMGELCMRCNLTVSQLSAMLLTLELAGHISMLPGGVYQRTH